MRKLALFATIAATLLVVSGCARWTLRPLHGQREATPGQTHERGSLSSLMRSPARHAAQLDATQDPTVNREINQGLEAIPRELAVARLSERQGDENQARQIYLKFIASDPRNPLPHHRLGVMAARKSKLDEAERHLRKALEVAPPSVELLNDMGYLCYIQSRFDEAEHYLLQSLEKSPDNTSATNNLALVYGARGDFSKSLNYFRRVNDDAKSHANVAFTMTQQGKLEDARNEYLHALTIDKSLKSAAHALVQIEQTRKAAEKAAKRNGEGPTGPAQHRDAIELASTGRPTGHAPSMIDARQPRNAVEPQYAPAAYQPQARPENLAATLAPQMQMPRAAAAPADQFAGRLMALPPLPVVDNAQPVAPQRGEREPVFTPLAQAEPQRELALRSDAVAATSTRPYSQFSAVPMNQNFAASTPAGEPAATFAQQPNNADAAIASIFSEARQVNWDDRETTASDRSAASRFATIPIPTSEPSADASTGSNVRQAIAVASTTPASNAVRPASSVQMGLSDAPSPAGAPKLEPVTAQFSDFGTAPARFNSTATTAPLSSTR